MCCFWKTLNFLQSSFLPPSAQPECLPKHLLEQPFIWLASPCPGCRSWTVLHFERQYNLLSKASETPKPESLLAEWNSLIECSKLITSKELRPSCPTTIWQMEKGESSCWGFPGTKIFVHICNEAKLGILRQHFPSLSLQISSLSFLCVTELIPSASTKLTHDDSFSLSSARRTRGVRFKMKVPRPSVSWQWGTTQAKPNAILLWSRFAWVRPLPSVADRWRCCKADHYARRARRTVVRALEWSRSLQPGGCALTPPTNSRGTGPRSHTKNDSYSSRSRWLNHS